VQRLRSARQDRWKQAVFALTLFIVAFGSIYLAHGYGTEARRIPMVVGIPLVVLALLNLVSEVSGRTDAKAERKSLAARPDSVVGKSDILSDEVRATLKRLTSTDAVEHEGGMRLSVALGATVLLVFFYVMLGQMLSIAPAIAIMMRIAKQSWGAVIVTVIVVYGMILLLTSVLGVQIYDGVVGPQLFEFLRNVSGTFQLSKGS